MQLAEMACRLKSGGFRSIDANESLIFEQKVGYTEESTVLIEATREGLFVEQRKGRKAVRFAVSAFHAGIGANEIRKRMLEKNAEPISMSLSVDRGKGSLWLGSARRIADHSLGSVALTVPDPAGGSCSARLTFKDDDISAFASILYSFCSK